MRHKPTWALRIGFDASGLGHVQCVFPLCARTSRRITPAIHNRPVCSNQMACAGAIPLNSGRWRWCTALAMLILALLSQPPVDAMSPALIKLFSRLEGVALTLEEQLSGTMSPQNVEAPLHPALSR